MKIKSFDFWLFAGLVLMATAVRSTTPEQQREAQRFFVSKTYLHLYNFTVDFL